MYVLVLQDLCKVGVFKLIRHYNWFDINSEDHIVIDETNVTMENMESGDEKEGRNPGYC
jgi:hypothetical protein